MASWDSISWASSPEVPLETAQYSGRYIAGTTTSYYNTAATIEATYTGGAWEYPNIDGSATSVDAQVGTAWEYPDISGKWTSASDSPLDVFAFMSYAPVMSSTPLPTTTTTYFWG